MARNAGRGRSRPSDTAALTASPARSHVSLSSRRIDNGYIVSEHSDGPEGFKCTERFSAKEPKLSASVAVADSEPNPMADAVQYLNERG